MSYLYQDLTKRIISCAIEVHKVLGPGLIESIYEEALAHEFDLRKIKYTRQHEVNAVYKGSEIGQLRLDFLVEGLVVLEIKSVEVVKGVFKAQLLSYLRATNKKLGLLINFNVVRLCDGISRMFLHPNLSHRKEVFNTLFSAGAGAARSGLAHSGKSGEKEK